jgi:hypothetical protein
MTIFQHLMNYVFHKYLDDFVICLINDVFILSKILKNKNNIYEILEKLKEIMHLNAKL